MLGVLEGKRWNGSQDRRWTRQHGAQSFDHSHSLGSGTRPSGSSSIPHNGSPRSDASRSPSLHFSAALPPHRRLLRRLLPRLSVHNVFPSTSCAFSKLMLRNLPVPVQDGLFHLHLTNSAALDLQGLHRRVLGLCPTTASHCTRLQWRLCMIASPHDCVFTTCV